MKVVEEELLDRCIKLEPEEFSWFGQIYYDKFCFGRVEADEVEWHPLRDLVYHILLISYISAFLYLYRRKSLVFWKLKPIWWNFNRWWSRKSVELVVSGVSEPKCRSERGLKYRYKSWIYDLSNIDLLQFMWGSSIVLRIELYLCHGKWGVF